MAMGKIVVYQDLEDIYVLCMRKVISSACENAWGGTDEGAFGTFKKHDMENTDTVNAEIDNRRKEAEEKLKEELEQEKNQEDNNGKKKKHKIKKINPDDFKHITAITAKAKSFKKFDFQACNNTLAHLEPVYKKVFKFYKISDVQGENCTRTSNELVRLRNRLAHPDPNDPPSKIVEYQKSCINYMNFMFGLGFGSVADDNGVTYYEQFQKKYIQYMEQELQRWYYLSDFLDLKHYDATRFLEVCATNNIVADKRDAKYLFRTSNLEETVEILKNNLAINGDNVTPRTVAAPSEAPAPVAAPVAPPAKKKNKLVYVAVVAVCALVLGGILLATTVLPAIMGMFKNGTKNPLPSTPTFQSSAVENGSSAAAENGSSSAAAENGEKNQIPSKHEGEVQALKYADSLTLRNRTLTVSVGGYVSPPPASVWDGLTIYSQNTDVAVAEGNVVKGVSRGTTYIIVESKNGTTAAFCVVVE
ncbi:MAG: hypothetical protein IJ370_07340 [Oscillospiraceae bacterium]|nr:hypothetical protein [Oscillospiraceae bacterium]